MSKKIKTVAAENAPVETAEVPAQSEMQALAGKKGLPTFTKAGADEVKDSRAGCLRQTAIEALKQGPTKLSDLVALGHSWYTKRGSFPKSETYTRVVELVRLINKENGYGLKSEIVDGDVVIELA